MSVSATSARGEYEALSQGASLQILLPRKHDQDLKPSLQRESPGDSLSDISTRRNLFFDESVTICLVLKTTPTNTEHLRQLLQKLEVTLSSHVTDAVPHGGGNAASASGKHDLVSRSFEGSKDPEIVAANDNLFVIWKLVLHLPWPRVRLQRPAIYFTASVAFDDAAATNTQRVQPTYLKSYEPLPANVLEPLKFEPSLSGSDVYLPEDRITKISPNESQSEERLRSIRGATKRAFPTVPALFSRLRYSRLAESVLVSLHLETAHVIAGTVTIEDVSLEAAGFHLRQLNATTWPKTTHPGDELIIVFQAEALREDYASQDTSPAKVTVHVLATAKLDQGSHVNLDICWHNQADLSPADSQPEYKWTRPLSGVSIPSNAVRKSSDSEVKRVSSDTGMTFSIKGPPSTTRGEEFSLRIQCINNSNRARRFSLAIAPNRQSEPIFQSSGADANTGSGDSSILETRKNLPDVLPLDADIRIGPLPAGACYETQLRLRAMKIGVLDLGVLRIFDADSRRMINVADLPDVVALGLN
ncbi:hypothetical protein MBLNU230_g6614t1 [Neophaeotheca triangularis]